MSKFNEYVAASIGANAVADGVKYGGLLYGIASVVEDKPDIKTVVAAGGIYVIGGLMSNLARILGNGAANEEQIGELEKKLDKP